jgi:ligand-binding sensor domain-containing protein/signal transduction histidine kinase
MGRIKKFVKITTLLLFLIINFSSQAGQKQLLFNGITTDDGLVSSNILSILQDNHGFIWIGTYDGLHRYDSKELKVYQNRNNEPNSLADNLIRSLFIDKNDNMFVGTNTGISLYNKNTDQFINFTQDTASCLFNFTFQANDITADNKGNIWIASNVGLVKFNRADNDYEVFTNDTSDPESISNSFCTGLHFDSYNRLWISTQQGINLYNPENKTFKLVSEGINGKDFSDLVYLKLTEDQNKNLWINSEDGLFRIKLTGDSAEKLQHFQPNPSDPNSISGNMLSGIYVDKENKLWIGAENNGLYHFNRNNQNFNIIVSNGRSVQNLQNISVNAVFQDNAGNLWIGTYGHGVLTVSKNSYAISLFQDIVAENKTYTSTLVNAFLEDRLGNIWIGTDGNGIFKFNKSTRKFKNYSTQNSGLGNDYILSMIEDENGNLWLASWDGGLIRFNPENETFTSFTTENSAIPGNKIYTVAKGENNKIWLGSHYGGLILFEPSENRFTSINKISNDLGENTVNVVKSDSKGNLYVGTTKGLIVYNPSEKRVKRIPGDSANLHIGNLEINDVTVENDTSIWVGTLMGMFRYNPETNKTSRYTTAAGLPGDIINAMINDNSGVLWVTTSNGICRFEPENSSITVFNKDDGMQSNEFRPRSALADSDGNLYFGGINGFNIIDPKKIARNKNVPKVQLTGLDIFHMPVKPGEPDSPLNKIIAETDKIVLDYDQSVLTFHFAVLDFTSPNKNKHAYMLENFDSEWTYSGNDRRATYTNLDPGKYIFRVKGANNDGVWNEEGASLIVEVQPPWWQTWWFKALLILVIAFTVLSVFYVRIKNLERQKHILEQRVEERTRELAKLNATKDKLFSIISHDLRSPFNVILGYTDVLKEQYKSFDEETINNVLSDLKESGENAFNLLENLLNWSSAQRGTIDFTPTKTTAAEITNSILPEVKSIAKKKNIKIINKVAGNEFPLSADKNMMSLIFRNVLTNAIKFSHAGSRIWIGAELKNANEVVFSVKDEGIGIAPEKVQTLFDLEENMTQNGTSGEKGTGLGLILSKEFIEMHNGKIWVESEPGKGSTFYFSVPEKIA